MSGVNNGLPGFTIWASSYRRLDVFLCSRRCHFYAKNCFKVPCLAAWHFLLLLGCHQYPINSTIIHGHWKALFSCIVIVVFSRSKGTPFVSRTIPWLIENELDELFSWYQQNDDEITHITGFPNLHQQSLASQSNTDKGKTHRDVFAFVHCVFARNRNTELHRTCA